MGLQKKVEINMASGVAGDKATPNQSIYIPINPVAAVPVLAGGFVFPVVEDGVTDNTQATNKAGDAEEALGFVERVINYYNYDLASPGTMEIPAGSTLTVAVRGDYYAVSSTAAKVGDKVLASKTDGSIITGDGDGIDTGWIVKTPGAKGELIIISNWNSAASAATTTTPVTSPVQNN